MFLKSHLSFLFMYMLHFANTASAVKNTNVPIVPEKRDSALPSIMTKLVNCNVNSIFAFMFPVL